MSAGHTPKPWAYGIRHDGSMWLSLGDPKTGPHYQGDLVATPDDAALIVSAPDILAERDRLKALNAELSKALEAVTDEATEIAELLALMGRLPASTGRDNAAIVGARAALAKQKESS